MVDGVGPGVVVAVGGRDRRGETAEVSYDVAAPDL